jgi:ornithine cyclodeaminase/alanine dehydrogenase
MSTEPLSATHTLLYLSRADVEKVALPMADIIDALERMFLEKGKGEVEMPPKPGIHPRKDAFIHAMPAYLPSSGAAGMKWVSGYPANRDRGLPYISGLLVLNDPETGIPTCVMDATWITAMRTGAATAVAAKYLARRDSSSVGIVACGVQGRTNLEALACVFDLKSGRAYDIARDVAETYAAEMSERFAIDVEVVGDPKEAVHGLDLVVTSGPILKDPRPTIPADWLSTGCFGCALDFDSYWQGAALQQADKFATDDKAQLAYYRTTGFFQQTPEPYADLGEIVCGRKPGREGEDERAICVNLGLALEDIATAMLIQGRARDLGIGQQLRL